jgi:hypothetical protein
VFEYGSDSPASYALLLVPLYVGVGRVKNQAHWQTDVIADCDMLAVAQHAHLRPFR